MNSFTNGPLTSEIYSGLRDASQLRVKIWRWFSPLETERENDGLKVQFDANQIASRFGNKAILPGIRSDPDSRLILVAGLQGLHYKSTIGLLAVHGSLEPVRLETMNLDGDMGLPMLNHALIDSRRDEAGEIRIKFR